MMQTLEQPTLPLPKSPRTEVFLRNKPMRTNAKDELAIRHLSQMPLRLAKAALHKRKCEATKDRRTEIHHLMSQKALKKSQARPMR
jgi:hypothetical protein